MRAFLRGATIASARDASDREGGCTSSSSTSRRKHWPRTAVSNTLDAASRLASEGQKIRCLGSTFLPDDETCFLLFETESAATIELVGVRAGFEYDRIVRALPLEPR